jgi:anti-anti-sigma factor
MMAATLANKCANPVTVEMVLDFRYIKDVLTVMFTCGLYDHAGERALRLALPAKSESEPPTKMAQNEAAPERNILSITTEELNGGITKVTLDGRLDVDGAAAVDSKMNAIAGLHKAVLVDLQKVSYLGSSGLRALLAPARTIKSHGGKMVIFGANEFVEKVLKTSGTDTLIPVHSELARALAALE